MNKSRTKRVVIMVTEEERMRLKVFAESQGRTVSNVLRVAVGQYIDSAWSVKANVTPRD